MRIGLIARADNTGLGIQSKGFFDHIPCKALVIDSSLLADRQTEILKPHLDRFPGCTVYQLQPGHGMCGGIPLNVLMDFVSDIDILFAMETPYDYNFFSLCRNLGKKTILQLNYEFLDYPSNMPLPDLFAAPSLWHFEDIPNVKTYLPVPVNLKDFNPQSRFRTFVHNAGRPAIHDRNGTATFMNSLQYVRSEINVIINSQIPLSFNHITRNPNVHIEMTFACRKNYYENYPGGVFVLPRKYGGLCLPMNEAIAAGMPVISTDISPNNKWLPEEWLVESGFRGTFRSRKHIEMWEADQVKLAQKIDQFCDETFYHTAIQKVNGLRERISWESLLPKYHKTFKDLLA